MMTAALPDGVSRETLNRLKRLEALLAKWNPAINLVAKSTIDQSWNRHILDSAQLFQLAPKTTETWTDLGSGGGFPGLVIAAIAAELRPSLTVTLVEADQRKATFLRQASRELDLSPLVFSQRIEDVTLPRTDILSARALAPLPILLGHADRFLKETGVALFPKGATWQAEVETARKDWHFDVTPHASMTDDQGAILAVKAISHV